MIGQRRASSLRQVKAYAGWIGTVLGMFAPITDQVPVLTEAMPRRLDQPGPRYTSNPAADRFVETFGPADHARALARRAVGATVGGEPLLSLSVHIPVCESVCDYCACNKVITKHHERAADTLDVLAQKIALTLQALGPTQALTQLHLGAGTPTFLLDAELSRLMATIRAAFRLAPGAEVMIEVDPRAATPDRLRHLAALGFNRLSFGVQDFDPDVQQAMHRVQPFDALGDLMATAREIGFQSINADLIDGLPKQAPASVARTVAQIASLRPDRIALYAYAHLPARVKLQRRIVTTQLPAPEQRVRMLGGAIAGFIAFIANIDSHIGMDHFALHDDALAVAKRQGRCTATFRATAANPMATCSPSACRRVGRMGATDRQNAKTLGAGRWALGACCDAVRRGQFPVVRGLGLTRDAIVRRAVVMALMCQRR